MYLIFLKINLVLFVLFRYFGFLLWYYIFLFFNIKKINVNNGI